MNFEQIKKADEKNVLHTYNRKQVAFERGNGMKLYDKDGKEYYDFLAGIAVCALGHSHPTLVKAISEQAAKVIHTSNYYYIEPQALLAENLCNSTCADRVFFANSGAEENEAALNLAKNYQAKNGHPERTVIITLNNSFHGRTSNTSSASESVKKKDAPPSDFIHVAAGDVEAFKNAISDTTCAVMFELIQGESGVHPIDKDYVKAVRKICTEKGILFIVDEVQTGMGRTGKLMAYQHFDIEPDIFTVAKALGGGVPIGAMCTKEQFAPALVPGEHGSTFGGNFLATAAGNAVFEVFEKEKLVENSEKTGKYFLDELKKLVSEKEIVKEARGIGLMLAIQLTEPKASEICTKMQEKGFIIGSVGSSILRFLPPLIVTKEDVDKLISALKEEL
ncbi:MAG: aspartate aminotransferase family protein [Clostridia bacterium]|nr:aspartate aminotransferase family protein [Clostridia bacterium]